MSLVAGNLISLLVIRGSLLVVGGKVFVDVLAHSTVEKTGGYEMPSPVRSDMFAHDLLATIHPPHTINWPKHLK